MKIKYALQKSNLSFKTCVICLRLCMIFVVPGRFALNPVRPLSRFAPIPVRPLSRFAPIPVRPGSFCPYSRSPSFINSALKNEIWKIPLQIFVFWML